MSTLHPTSDKNFSAHPLLGKKILITRPYGQGFGFAQKLKELGAIPISMPMMEITPPDSWQKFDEAIDKIESYDWLIFVSTNAVRSFSQRLLHKTNVDIKNAMQWQAAQSLPPTVLSKLPKIAVIGPSTRAIAELYGLKVDYCPSKYLAEDFIDQFPGYPKQLSGIKMLWTRGDTGRDYISEKLQSAAAKLEIITAYQSSFPAQAKEFNSQLEQLIKDKELDVITLASRQTAINLAKVLLLKNASFDISRNLPLPSSSKEEALHYLKGILAPILIVTIGPEASAGALNYLGKADLEANQHTTEGMITALVEHYA